MNNSKVRYLHSLPKYQAKPIYKIAVVSPANKETGQHILMGVALKQQLLVNQDKNPDNNKLEIIPVPDVFLEVKIANDENLSAQSVGIANNLIENDEIKAVIGPCSTESAKATLKIHTKAADPLAVVSPTASATGLNIFFRR
jgi:ABC-type branched-subunit amino acid transport system substrate-binding protein